MEENNKILVKGIKSQRGSIKILQTGMNSFIVEHKKYLGTICYRKVTSEFQTLDDAEDKFLELRYEARNRRFPNFLS